MTVARDHLSKADTVIIAAIEVGVPVLVEARRLMEWFHAMIRKKTAADLEAWIAEASTSLIAPLRQRHRSRQGRCPRRNHRAVVERSNGTTDHKAELVKRQMYGRGKIDLLQARLIGAA